MLNVSMVVKSFFFDVRHAIATVLNLSMILSGTINLLRAMFCF